MTSSDHIRENWLGFLLSTEAADRLSAEAAVQALYAASGLAQPRHFFWFDAPFDACWANAILTAPYSQIWRQLLAAYGQVKAYRENLDRVRAMLCRSASQPDLGELLKAVGAPMGSPHVPMAQLPGHKTIQTEILLARFSLYGGAPPFTTDQTDALVRAESALTGAGRGALGHQMADSTVNAFVALSMSGSYSFSQMADDEKKAGADPPPILAAAWALARACGPWWPYTHAAILTDRPVEIHLNEQTLLHRGDGPAALYRDGTPVYAWSGTPLPARWILDQDKLTPRELRQFDPAFRAYVAARFGAPAPAATRIKPSAALALDLPSESSARLEILRTYNNDSLPLYDRYIAGEHAKVWKELVALGPAVRHDPYAADALAVAYEIMRRVELNVRAVTARLDALEAASGPKVHTRNRAPTGHLPPGPKARKLRSRLEKKAGDLPLSLRAFYEIVGEVDWMGRRAWLDTAGGICPDPLVLFPIEAALAECESWEETDEDTIITLAPDDLHKENVSGGEPYGISVPDSGADAILLNERHRLMLVDYLRLCFQFGGFPGFEGMDRCVPAEIDALRQDLVLF